MPRKSMENLSLEEKLIAEMRLTKDLKNAATQLSSEQARYLIDLYYMLQQTRIGFSAQVRSAADEPNELLSWSVQLYSQLETDVKQSLEIYANTTIVGKWALSILGIGPVIAAGLQAHINMERCPSVGHIWRYAGLDPTVTWEKKTKRPWNAQLKTLCWHIGQSFVKVSNRERDYYGRLYKQRKAYEVKMNEDFEYRMQAVGILEKKNISKDTDAYAAYSQGKLPPAQIEQRAQRWTTKIFLSHWHAVAYRDYYKQDPPTPWAIQFGGHTDILHLPNWPFETKIRYARGRTYYPEHPSHSPKSEP